MALRYHLEKGSSVNRIYAAKGSREKPSRGIHRPTETGQHFFIASGLYKFLRRRVPMRAARPRYHRHLLHLCVSVYVHIYTPPRCRYALPLPFYGFTYARTRAERVRITYAKCARGYKYCFFRCVYINICATFRECCGVVRCYSGKAKLSERWFSDETL